MIKKRGAIHVDWVISMGIFLIYLIILLVFIKPSYKAKFEEDVLTKMVKDEFLNQNNVSAGFIVYTTKVCEAGVGPSSIKEQLKGKLPSIIDKEDIYVNTNANIAYFLYQGISDSDDPEDCIDAIGEVFYYKGLKGNLEEIGDFGFPDSRNYKINIYKIEENGDLIKDESFGSTKEPSTDDEVYVLDWSSSKLLGWDSINNKIERENVIINIQVW